MSQERVKPKVFISHIGEEAPLAHILQRHFSKDFLGMIEVFVSSDSSSISVGRNWLNQVDDALKQAKVELLVCSRESVTRPWVNFEAGAGWVRDIPLVPICHTGVRPVDLPIPLNLLQGINANDADELKTVYELLAKQLDSSIPEADFEQIASEVADFERQYGMVRSAARSVKPILDLLPDLERVFRPHPESNGSAPRNRGRELS